MGKKKKIKENKDKIVKSINKNVRSSTRKLNPKIGRASCRERV